MYYDTIISGFGGQGVLFSGKLLSMSAMLMGKQVTWMPSYGPEMRGGTANCSVVISDKKIGSPVIEEPMSVIALNLPSKNKFENLIAKSGIFIINSSIVEHPPLRDDINNFYIPLNKLANELGELRALNVMAVGSLLKQSGIIPLEIGLKALEVIFQNKPKMIEVNKIALEIGYNYTQSETYESNKQLQLV